MSRTKNLILLLEACEKHEFDKIVKEYLKHEFNFQKIVFTDGSGDTGIDIKVFDFKDELIQYQLTTQKSKSPKEQKEFEAKLNSDLEKAKVNYTTYKYSRKLIFFYSKELTNAKIRIYERLAFKDYGIDLELIEANRIAEEAENIISIQNLLYQLNDLPTKVSIFDDEKENLIYDLLSFGKPSEFKLQIVEAFILQSIYRVGKLTKDQILELCKKKFEVNENDIFYDRLLSKLQTDKRIKKSLDKLSFMLTEIEEFRLKRKTEQHEIDEQILVKEIKNILQIYSQENLVDEYIIQLKNLYIDNFHSDLNALLNDSDHTKLFGVIRKFKLFIESKILDKDKSIELAKALLKLCLENKFIQKIAASKVYCEKINYERLETYLNAKKRIFIDTSIALNALCYFYNPKFTYGNYFYKAAKNLIEYAQKERIELFISERYIWEIQNHIKEAFNIVPFSTIPNFHALGNSRNVFYNYYLSLINSDQLQTDVSFNRFLTEYGFQDFTSIKSNNSKIEYFLQEVGIKTYKLTKDYEIEDANKLFELELDKTNKFKTRFSRNNDSIMLEFLADKDVNIHPLQPLFLTWDKTFFNVHEQYLARYPNAQNWLILSPTKLIDAYAILKFSINSETVTESLLALISDDIISNTHSLVDNITYILNTKDEIGLEYVNRIADIRKDELHKITNNEIVPPDNTESDAVLDDVFYHLTKHYEKRDEIDLFRIIFTRKEFINEVISLLLKAVEDFYKVKRINEDLFAGFDKMIVNVKSEL